MEDYFAHSANKAGSTWEPLKEHLARVANRAREYAKAFGCEQEATIAGLWHDLGKYSAVFTHRLSGEVSGLDHWSIGAIAALHSFKDRAIAAALAIQGHHIGLQEGFGGDISEGLDLSKLSDPATHPHQLRLTDADWKSLVNRFIADGFETPTSPLASLYDLNAPPVSAMLDARMLFSALVDADYIETEAHFDGKADGTKVYRPTGASLQARQALEIIVDRIAKLEVGSSASTNVQTIRKQLLEACLVNAGGPRGIFTLTAPTAAGKTLAMLAFGMKHATIHPDIRRVVMVVPFLSIIEQTADVYRRLLEPHFGPHYVLQHHTLADLRAKREDGSGDLDNEEEASRTAHLLTENWDAPLILTTSVQFFESLFANRPAKCRKLHRLANSVILFDEVQTLPPRIAVPSLAALSRLSERYGCTVVFSTATQPAFDHFHDNVKACAANGWKPQTITEDQQRLFHHAKRVSIDWQINESISWESVADRLARDENARSLCVVNLKRHASKLVNYLRKRLGEDGLFHISTNMCPAHRQKVLSEVRERLHPGNPQPCRLVSTQCIEAGVDVDFPVVWRAFGPLDAIAQAAGRCNREGKLDRKGRMVVFLPEKEIDGDYLYPPGGYKQASDTTKTLFEKRRLEAQDRGIPVEENFDIYNPDLFNEYYHLLYDLTGMAEFDPDRNELANAIHRRSFIDVATAPYRYRVIEQSSINVLVPYADEISKFDELKEKRLTRDWIQEARPLTVSMYRPRTGNDVWQYLEPVLLSRGEKADDWFVYLNPKDYDPLLGLNPRNNVGEWTI